MKKVVEVIGEGIGQYGRNAANGMSMAVIGLVRAVYGWALFLTLFFGVLCLLISMFTHRSEAWSLTIGLFFWNLVLFVGRHVLREAMAGRFNTRHH